MSFFDKLKNSVGIEETEEKKEEKEKVEEKEKPRKQHENSKTLRENSEQSTKIQIKGSKSENKEEWFQPEGELAVDVFQTDTDIVIQSTIAGVKPEELDLSIEDDVVTISGERKNPNEEGEKSYFYQECYWGPFSRQIILPEEVDFNLAEATMKDGIFTVRMPKLQRQKMRKIKVRG